MSVIYGDIWGIPSGNLLQFAIENGPVEIVDFPIKSMVDRSIVFCKRLPGRVMIVIHWNWIGNPLGIMIMIFLGIVPSGCD